MAKVHLPSSGPIYVYAEVAGSRAKQILIMALDTGAVPTMIPIETAIAIGYDPAASTKRMELVTASGIELAPQVMVRAMSCLGRTVRDLSVVCHNLPAQSPVKGLLGLNFLRHFDVRLNFLTGTMELRGPSPSN